jgi:hypothetical protein
VVDRTPDQTTVSHQSPRWLFQPLPAVADAGRTSHPDLDLLAALQDAHRAAFDVLASTPRPGRSGPLAVGVEEAG